MVAVTAPDGTWRWQAPQMANLVLQFRKPGLLWLGAGTAWLRPGKTYDLGTRVLRGVPIAIRLTDPRGVSVTRFLSPDALVDEDGWTTLLVEDPEALWDALLILLENVPPERVIQRAFAERSLDLTTDLVRAIVKVTYPDQTPAPRADVYWGYERFQTDADGEAVLFQERRPSEDVDTLFVAKGDYSKTIDLREFPEQQIEIELPRGGDLQIELVPESPLPLAPLGFMVDTLDDHGELTAEPSHFVGRFIGTVENIAPGTRRMYSNLIYGDEWISPGEFVAEVRRNELTKRTIQLRARDSKPLEVRVIDALGFPIAGASVDFGLERAITDSDGRVTLTRYALEKQPKITVEHPTEGYADLDSDEFSKGPITVVLEPWVHLELQVIDSAGEQISDAEVSIDPDVTLLHVRHFEDEIPWYCRRAEGHGSVKALVRPNSQDLVAQASHLWKSDTITLQAGERTKTIRWILPPLREVKVQILDRGEPATGSAELFWPVPPGWTAGGSKLDRNGETVLFTPALDPSTPLTIDWYDWETESRRRWTVPVDGSATLDTAEP